MTLPLDQATFRRLILGYALAGMLQMTAVVYEVMAPGWREFSDSFDKLVEQHFGVMSDAMLIFLGILLLGSIVLHVAALIGLWKLQNWARAVFWISLLIWFPIGLAPGLNGPYYYGWASGLTNFAGCALFGTIVLLAYSKDHGTIWFGSRTPSA